MFRRISRQERERRAARAELETTLQALRSNERAFTEAQDPFYIDQLTYQHAALMCRCRALLALKQNIEQQKACQTTKDGDRFLEIDNEFHRLIFECAGKMWSYHFVEEQMVHFDRLRALAAKSGYAKSTIPDHEDILYALKRKDAEMSEIFMTRHLTRYQTEKTEIMKQYPEYFTK